jgi:hemoglobin
MVTPTVFEWLGGEEALARLFRELYARVPDDPLLAPVFANMPREHAEHVAAFVGEVLGGPPAYTASGGAHAKMIRRHAGRALTQAQRKRWLELLLECADAVGVPDDPEFRSALVGYLEWGSRLAVINSQPGAPPTVADDAPMPAWGWGEVKGPYRGDAASPPSRAQAPLANVVLQILKRRRARDLGETAAAKPPRVGASKRNARR